MPPVPRGGQSRPHVGVAIPTCSLEPDMVGQELDSLKTGDRGAELHFLYVCAHVPGTKPWYRHLRVLPSVLYLCEKGTAST